MDAITPENLKFLVNALVHPDRKRQRETVEKYFTDDVTLIHFMGTLQGRDKYYYSYRCAASWLIYNVTFQDIVIQDNTAVMWVTLNVKQRLCPLLRTSIPTIVFMKFRDVDGKKRAYLQHDHHSLYALFNPIGPLYTRLLQPLGGALLVAQGLAVDLALAAWTIAAAQAYRAATCASETLSSMLESYIQSLPQAQRVHVAE